MIVQKGINDENSTYFAILKHSIFENRTGLTFNVLPYYSILACSMSKNGL